MTDIDLSGLIFFGYIGVSLAISTIVFRKTKEKPILTKILMRSGVLSFFYSPCVFIGPGILVLPSIVVLAYTFNSLEYGTDNAAPAIISLIFTFAILSTVSYLRFVRRLFKS